jgi:hypothetical protein
LLSPNFKPGRPDWKSETLQPNLADPTYLRPYITLRIMVITFLIFRTQGSCSRKFVAILRFFLPEFYVCDFGVSKAVRRKVAQENFSSCHHIFILGVKERKAKREEHTDN